MLRPDSGHRSAPHAPCGHGPSCRFDTCSKKHTSNRSAVTIDRCAGEGKTGQRERAHSGVVRRGSGGSQLIQIPVFIAHLSLLASAEGALDARQRLASTRSMISMPTRSNDNTNRSRKYSTEPTVIACGCITSAGWTGKGCASLRQWPEFISISITGATQAPHLARSKRHRSWSGNI